MKEQTKHLIVISFDGLSSLDFEYIRTLPNFKRYLNTASYCNKVYSVYPSLTYPAHATIVTGKYPKNHGIINNTLLQINKKSPDWYWYRKDIQGETFYDLAIKKGKKVAALLWPVTAKSKIQYNMPEIFANRPWQNQIFTSLFNGSPLYQFELNKKFGNLRDGLSQPNLDNFTHESLLYTIKHKKTDLILVHYTDLDSARHNYGFNSNEATLALKRHDRRLADIINTLLDQNIYDESTIVILGDHSSLDEKYVVNLNVLLLKNGYIHTDTHHNITSYKAIAKNCDGSAYVYVNNDDKETIKRIYNLILEFNKANNCIDIIYTKDDAVKLGADPKCALMLEAKLGFYFQDELHDDIIIDLNQANKFKYPHYTKATHGYSPYKENYTTVFMAAGCGIRKNIIIDEMNLVDEAPTIANLLGIDLKDVDGKVIQELFEK
ncbi:ectonucleotide pyrophosphatase/phosphodiesterase [Inconstantimicrobium mannanitabidum]|uniref:Alkaline phosphatase family protein n=1 Tax=Inconstantimicrobium mannanitabidum TaxID=1604901 RepID=A0ACB5R7V2_9CLOT|nr:ectonucleotide pyrophosphatase/phosphodiesterase [Clostridium sp. TW13]GKX65242.1 alkaline phosphatase family protein [Clostridium sp. TW13]